MDGRAVKMYYILLMMREQNSKQELLITNYPCFNYYMTCIHTVNCGSCNQYGGMRFGSGPEFHWVVKSGAISVKKIS